MKKQLNYASLARYGQDTVQEIIAKAKNLFHVIQTYKSIYEVKQERDAIKLLFGKLRLIYQRLNDFLQENRMDYTDVESMVPYKDGTPKSDETKVYKLACKERDELRKEVCARGEQIKEIINSMRTIIFEINNMMAMTDDEKKQNLKMN